MKIFVITGFTSSLHHFQATSMTFLLDIIVHMINKCGKGCWFISLCSYKDNNFISISTFIMIDYFYARYTNATRHLQTMFRLNAICKFLSIFKYQYMEMFGWVGQSRMCPLSILLIIDHVMFPFASTNLQLIYMAF